MSKKIDFDDLTYLDKKYNPLKVINDIAEEKDVFTVCLLTRNTLVEIMECENAIFLPDEILPNEIFHYVSSVISNLLAFGFSIIMTKKNEYYRLELRKKGCNPLISV